MLFKEIVDGRTDGRRTPDIEGSQKLTEHFVLRWAKNLCKCIWRNETMHLFKNVVIVCNIIKGIQSYLWVQIPIYIVYQNTWYKKKAIIGYCLAINNVHCKCFFTFTFCCKQRLLRRLLADDWSCCSVFGGVWGVGDGGVGCVDDCGFGGLVDGGVCKV